MVEGVPSKKFEIAVTTRDYSELNKFLARQRLTFTRLGKHGGGDLLEKLKASIARENELISFAKDGNFDYSFSFISPEAARVSFGLGIPHIICSDSPHARAPSKLAVPLSNLLFTPFPILRERWTQYGLEAKRVMRYHALDPWAWLNRAKVKVPKEVKGKVMIRLEEWFASYFRHGLGVSSVLGRLIDEIHKLGDFEVTLVPRYDDQRRWAEREFSKKALVPNDAIDGVEGISQTDLLIGGGATMTQEAALMGVPNISYFPSAELDVFSNYYFPKRLSIEASNQSDLIAETVEVLKNIEKEKEAFLVRAKKETAKFEDPVSYIFSNISKSTRK